MELVIGALHIAISTPSSPAFILHPKLIPDSTTLFNQTPNNPTPTTNMQNDKGQGVSHATDSQVPQKVQEKVAYMP